MMHSLSALLCGSLFGAGLVISGCTDTATIHAWLDVLGSWKPTLGFFFVSSCGVMALGWQLSKFLNQSLLGVAFPKTNKPRPDIMMIGGSAMFWIGWGRSGICPGPSLAGLTSSGPDGLQFFMAMVLGMYSTQKIKTGFDNWIHPANTKHK